MPPSLSLLLWLPFLLVIPAGDLLLPLLLPLGTPRLQPWVSISPLRKGISLGYASCPTAEPAKTCQAPHAIISHRITNIDLALNSALSAILNTVMKKPRRNRGFFHLTIQHVCFEYFTGNARGISTLRVSNMVSPDLNLNL